MRRRKNNSERDAGLGKIKKTQEWFKKSVTYRGEPYTIDEEQAAAVVDESLNTIVTARAGSGKTRTIVAKIVYLIAKQKVDPEEIIAFVFNRNAAEEINDRLSEMRVDGETISGSAKIATTFHAFARKIVYDICDGRGRCQDILAEEKETYILAVVKRMIQEKKWEDKIIKFFDGNRSNEIKLAGERGKVIVDNRKLSTAEIVRFAGKMEHFIGRAQQKFLGRKEPLSEIADEYIKEYKKLNNHKMKQKERLFLEIGVECHRRYHWCLLDANRRLKGFPEYGTDFNLIVSWASTLIQRKDEGVKKMLKNKKHILIDEYQDFSQLFLAAVLAIRGVARKAKLFVVGDDWQAINRFAGSDVEYFKNFEKYFPDDVRRYEITTNYRCDQMVVDASWIFMKKSMKEKGRFYAKSRRMGKVVIVDPRFTLTDYVAERGRWIWAEDALYVRVIKPMARRKPSAYTVKYFKTLTNVIEKNRKAKDILILHRNNDLHLEDISLTQVSHALKKLLAKQGIMTEDEYDEKIQVMTMHKSKGLEAEVVIILEADEGVIPKEHPDVGIYGIFGESGETAMEDQKRLFYVAMTRAKRRLYIMHDDSNGKGFIRYLGKGIEKWEE